MILLFEDISHEELRGLAAIESPQCVSFYLPTHVSGPDTAEDRIRLKNLITRAKSELAKQEMRAADVANLLRPVEAMMDDSQFWSHADAGLAVFVSQDGMKRYRLPESVEEAVLVSDRLWIAPLLPFVSADVGFYILALSENAVRLLHGSRYRVSELSLGDTPTSMAEALRFDDREPHLNSHGANRVGAGRVSATFHGQGGAKNFDDVDLSRFLHHVDRGVVETIGSGSDPLVLSGAEGIVSRFKNETSYRNTAGPFINGNPEHLTPQDLHERALPLAMSHLNANQPKAQELFGSPSVATVDSAIDAVEAARSGRVAQLFLARGSQVWGSIDPENGQVLEHEERQPGDHDLVDLAARETLGHGGEVFAVDTSEMPIDGRVAAVLRY